MIARVSGNPDKAQFQEGILLLNLKRFNNKSFIVSHYTRFQDLTNAIEVNLNDVELSFDDGISWFYLDELSGFQKTKLETIF